MANSSNVTLRVGIGRPLTYEEVDLNFQELKYVIDDYNAFYRDEFQINEEAYTTSGTIYLDVSSYNSFIIDVTQASTVHLTNPKADNTQEVWIKTTAADLLTWNDSIFWQEEYYFESSLNYKVFQLLWMGNQWHGKVVFSG